MKRAVRVCSEVNRVFSDVSCAANIAAKKEIKKGKGRLSVLLLSNARATETRLATCSALQ